MAVDSCYDYGQLPSILSAKEIHSGLGYKSEARSLHSFCFILAEQF